MPRPILRAAALSLTLAGAALFHACTSSVDNQPDAASAPANIQAAWVEIGDANQAIARVITNYAPPPAAPGEPAPAVCPQLNADGKIARMTLRVAAGTAAQRPTASDPADSKPSSFPVSVCETTLPANAKDVSVASRALPLPKAEPQ
ncbi:serine/threonine protein phosphatase, partial [Burkholderia pseudomallei]|nr:serine/threonine protein phosphatase [Burkholderia pseudomallei]MBD2928363.1 serine/threonine protein phosphatase [Burkholderia pseudomallei]MBD2934546.1 serine/threonine protein phosphatase [Burkholderia pseudomallei]MBD2971410.1 serine/threonine protein phosphatase [Burkholderia pseudomallei]MBM5577915.1 serine/threonine protein phosphatase [Burkholderia pseudomallei]